MGGPSDNEEKYTIRHRESENRKHCQGGKVSRCYCKGAHLYTIVLHYCAALALIAVGVLSKPHFGNTASCLNRQHSQHMRRKG